MVQYNTERPHQSLGMRPPAERFALAPAGPDPAVVDPIAAVAAHRQTPTPRPDLRHAGVQRWVDQRGSIRLAGFGYRVPIVLAGEPVEAVVADNLVQIYHHDVLVASHVQRCKPDATPAVPRQGRRTPRTTSTGIVVTRMVKHPRFLAHLVTCDRCAFRHGVERSTRPRLRLADVVQGGASACVRCTSSPTPR